MTTTLTLPADRARDDLRAGDRIIALDGALLPRTRTVANPKHLAGPNRVPAVNLVNHSGSDVEWNLYLRNFDEVTVEREVIEEPVEGTETASTPKRRTRTVGDVVLVSHGDGFWASEDFTWVISREQRGTIICEEPHPVRITAAMVEYAKGHPRSLFAADILPARRSGKKGFLCPGGVEHDGEPVWVLNSPVHKVSEMFDRFDDALAAVKSEMETQQRKS